MNSSSLHFTRPLLIFILFVMACKSDRPSSLSNASPIEQNYFEDYESPKHKWGCINRKGEVVIDPIYDDLKDMQSGLAAANYQGRWGYIDSLGSRVIDFKYKQAYNFTADRTIVQNFDNKWILISKKGTVLDTLTYSSYESFYGEYAVVGNGQSKGVIDSHAELVVPLVYQNIKLAPEKKFIAKRNGKYGLSEISGAEIIPYEYDRIFQQKNGLFRLKKDGLYQYADGSEKIYPGTFVKAYDYSYEKTVVKDEEGYKLISTDQKELSILEYDFIDYAGESKWKYKKDAKWGLLNENGEELTEAKYDLINRFSNGMVASSKGAKWGYLDSSGDEIIDFKHPLVWDFHDGLARVIDNRGVGFIDRSGKLVIEDIFIEVRDFYNGRARFQTY